MTKCSKILKIVIVYCNQNKPSRSDYSLSDSSLFVFVYERTETQFKNSNIVLPTKYLQYFSQKKAQSFYGSITVNHLAQNDNLKKKPY